MNQNTLNARFQHKLDTSRNWSRARNFIPMKGELIYYSDLRQWKIGDGELNPNSLPFTETKLAPIPIRTIDAICDIKI